MIYIESESTDPTYNLALEETLFSEKSSGETCFMLWQNDRTVVIGRHQNAAEEIDADYVHRHGIRVVRRLSGGGAVYHDLGNLNFTFITDRGRASDLDFRYFVQPVAETLAGFGVKAEFSGRNDITIGGRKFSGNSQYLRGDRLLHHGCILVSGDLSALSGALAVRPDKFESKSTKSVRSRVTTINEHADPPVSIEEFKAALLYTVAKAAAADEGLRVRTLTAEEDAAVRRLAQEKYASWEWTWGNAPDYAVRREKRFPAGLVSARMDVSGGTITGIRFYGDFFAKKDLSELEAALCGVRLDNGLAGTLAGLGADAYIDGVGSIELAMLLLGM